ncbi:MAG: hypothetical protein KDK39_19930, partial [Leptospiraceae bacterium]|nr:hypothetical protein [Leptospiraceae bacterium]
MNVSMGPGNRVIIFLGLLLVTACQGPAYGAWRPLPGGAVELSPSEPPDGVLYKLDCEWQFLPGVFVDPADRSAWQSAIPVRLPAEWNQLKTAKHSFADGRGIGSYRLRIQLPAKHFSARQALMYRAVLSAHRLYVNGILHYESGQAGPTAVTTIPHYGIAYVPLLTGSQQNQSSGDAVELLFHVANFNHRTGGISDSVIIGPQRVVLLSVLSSIMTGVFISGVLLIMGLYHIGLWLARPADKPALLFGLFCLVISGRVYVTGQMFFAHQWLGLDFATIRRLDYLSVYFGALFFCSFIIQLFGSSKKAVWHGLVQALIWPFVLFILVRDPYHFSFDMLRFQYVLLLLAVLTLSIQIYALQQKRSGAGLSLLGSLILIGGTVNDILYARNLLLFGQVIQYAVTGFVLLQSITLARGFASTHQRAERMSERL